MHTDVLVAGGGPAGLAAAISARENGLRVTVIDSRRPPIDKTCGEGLLPESVSALRTLGVDVGDAHGFRFHGIRFADADSSAAARFGGATAFGVRRSVLHQLLVDRAEAVGVELLWGAHLSRQDNLHAEVSGRYITFRWLVAADGLNSRLRREARMDSRWRSRGRFAFRRHYALAPWSDLVEVHWARECQMIVTPVGAAEICVALFTGDQRLRIDAALANFPELSQRLRGARATSPETGARTALARAGSVVRGNMALVGDASCSIDGIAGQGLNLAFREAICLGRALAREDLSGYARAHREITETPMRLTRLLLLMAQVPLLQRKALRMFASKPSFFAKMISIHTGAVNGDLFGLHDLFGLGWRVLRA